MRDIFNFINKHDPQSSQQSKAGNVLPSLLGNSYTRKCRHGYTERLRSKQNTQRKISL